MRFFFIFVFAIMFIVKSGVNSSLHHDLFHKMKYHSSNHYNFQKEVNFSNCHEQKENEKPLDQSHCEIVCLCSHFSSNINFFSQQVLQNYMLRKIQLFYYDNTIF